MAIIYQATNLIDGRRYIGRTGHTLGTRIAQHFNIAGRRNAGHFHNALNKYGRAGFRWSILMECDASAVSEHEVRLIFLLKPEYNSKRRSSGRPTVDRYRAPQLPPDWSLDGEEWRDVPGYEGYYQISAMGRVRGLYRRAKRQDGKYGVKHPAIMRLRRKSQGNTMHLYVSLTKNCKDKEFGVHQLVALAFIGLRPNNLSVLHKNDVGDDNVPGNLYYGTQQQNVADRCRNGKTARGERCTRAKLTSDAVLFIFQNKDRLGQREMGRMLGVTHTSIRQVLNGISWKHVEVH